MAKIACTVMLKDEAALVYPFLAYHASLFGAENLYVFDNGSTDKEVLNTLRYFEQVGTHVNYEFNTPQHYRQKGAIVGNLIKQLDIDCDYDFYILLDCDEFVVLDKDGSFSCEKGDILSHLEEFLGEKRIITVNKNLSNVPGRVGLFQSAPYSKTIFPHGVLVSVDHGHHIGVGRFGAERVPSKIAYVHYHYRNYEELVRFAKQKLQLEISEEQMKDREFLRSYKGRGWHLISHLLTDKADYYQQFENSKRFIEWPSLIVKFLKLNIKPPFSAPNWTTSQFRYEVTIDECNEKKVRGWAIDRIDSAEPVRLKFLANDDVIWQGACDLQRPDVKRSGRPSELVGFDVSLPTTSAGIEDVSLSIKNMNDEPMTFRVRGKLVDSFKIENKSNP